MADGDAATGEKTTTKKAPTKKAPSKKTSAKRSPAKRADASNTDTSKTTTKKTAAAKAEPSRRPGAGGIARQAAVQIQELTGHEVEGVTGVHRDGDGWVVEVDLLELRRIPATTDVIATYEVEVDESGDLMGYKRRDRFVRGNVGEGR